MITIKFDRNTLMMCRPASSGSRYIQFFVISCILHRRTFQFWHILMITINCVCLTVWLHMPVVAFFGTDQDRNVARLLQSW